MQNHTTSPGENRLGLAACCLFIALSAVVIPLAGIQTDEALFATPLYQNIHKGLLFHIRHLPPMVMTYIGSLKTLVYGPILRMFGTGVWAVRLPVVLLGALTIWFFFQLTRRSAGPLAAALGVLFLATDPVFLLTNTMDWGPVAIDHILLVTGCFCLLRFGSQQPSDTNRVMLFLGFLFFGLALWNKAIFIWGLAGVTAGGLLVFWPEIRQRWERKNLAVAVAALLLGASPLVVYNLLHASVTVRDNAHLDAANFSSKWIQVESALNGQSLFGYMVNEESAPNPKVPSSLLGRASVRIRNEIGQHRKTGFYYVSGALLLLAAPWWWKYRAARFSLVFFAVAWLAMALTKDAGGSAHHVILLWPFPILFAAVALASLPWRWVAVTIGIGVVTMNLLVVNQYISQFERYGAGDTFTDAIFPLSQTLDSEPGHTFYLIDWGVVDAVNLLDQGRVNLRVASGPLETDSPDQTQQREIAAMLTDPTALFVGHVPEREAFPKVGAHLERAAQALGYRKELLQSIPDSNGRPVFEVFRFVSRR